MGQWLKNFKKTPKGPIVSSYRGHSRGTFGCNWYTQVVFNRIFVQLWQVCCIQRQRGQESLEKQPHLRPLFPAPTRQSKSRKLWGALELWSVTIKYTSGILLFHLLITDDLRLAKQGLVSKRLFITFQGWGWLPKSDSVGRGWAA